MADIMLCLLIIFMVVTPLLGPGVAVELAQVQDPVEYDDVRDDSLIIAVTRDGALYLGRQRITEAEVGQRVRDLLAGRAGQVVFIKSDARARYGRVAAVVDEIRSAGVDQIALLTDRARDRNIQEGTRSWE